MAQELWANALGTTGAITTLSGNGGSVSAGATAFSCASLAGFPSLSAGQQYRCVCDTEIIIVTATSGSSVTACTRGAEGTTAATHQDGATFALELTAAQVTALATASGIVGDATTTASGLVEVDNAPSGAHPVALTTDGTSVPSGMLGTTGSKAAAGNDSRLSDARTPTSHAPSHAATGSDPLTLTPAQITGTAVVTGDSRLSDARTPVAHKTSHATGGTDALTPADIGALSASDASVTNSRTPTAHAGSHAAAGSDPLALSPSQITGTAVVTTDSRLSDTRIPTDASVTDAKVATGAAIAPAKIAGTAVTTADSRLSDSRTPTAHASTHAAAGSDPLTLPPSQITGTAVITTDTRLSDARTPTSHAATHGSGAADAVSLDAAQIATGTLVYSRLPVAGTNVGAVKADGTTITNTAGTLAAVNTGTVTSVGLSVPGLLYTVSGSPVTNSGTLTTTLKTQVANTVLAGPTTGVDAAPTMRVLVAADIPALAPSKITGTAVITTDSRLSDARTPTAHAATHLPDGSDSLAQLLRLVPGPAVHGYTTWTYDAAMMVANINPTAGVVYLHKILTAHAYTINAIDFVIGIGGSGATALANCFLGIYDSGGTRRFLSADQSSSWSGAGAKSLSLGTPYTVTANDFVYVAFVIGTQATTALQFRGVSTISAINSINLTNATYRFASQLTGQTTLPATLTLSSNASPGLNMPWFAVR